MVDTGCGNIICHGDGPLTGPAAFRHADRIVLPDEGEWMASAACIGVDPDIMFPEPGKGHARDDRPAKAVCAECTVREPCLEYALAWPEPQDKNGVFGGFNPAERRRIRRVRAGLPLPRSPGRPPKINDKLGQIGEVHRRAVERLQARE